MDTEIVRDFRNILDSYKVGYAVLNSKESIIFEIKLPFGIKDDSNLAQVEIYADGSVVGMIDFDFPQYKYFHCWQILPNSADYKSAVQKILSAVEEIPEPISNRILNASKS